MATFLLNNLALFIYKLQFNLIMVSLVFYYR